MFLLPIEQIEIVSILNPISICQIVQLENYISTYFGILSLNPDHIWFESNFVNFEIPEGLNIVLGSS